LFNVFNVGANGTVTAPLAVLYSLDGNANTNDTQGLFKIAGDLEVTGTFTSGGGDVSAQLDALDE
jgi:hypothetical protein